MKTLAWAVALGFLVGFALGISPAQAEEKAKNEAELATQLCEAQLGAGIGTTDQWLPQTRVDTWDLGPFKAQWTNTWDSAQQHYANTERQFALTTPLSTHTYTDLRGVCLGYGAEVQKFMKTRRGAQ